jgi:hypothetical protein
MIFRQISRRTLPWGQTWSAEAALRFVHGHRSLALSISMALLPRGLSPGLSPGLHGFAIASALYGTVFGSLFGGCPADSFGRKTATSASH